MKVSIKTEVTCPKLPLPVWAWTLEVRAGDKGKPLYRTHLLSPLAYRTRNAAVRDMRQADHAVRFQFRKAEHRRLTARELRSWWAKWTAKKVAQADLLRKKPGKM